MESGEGQGPDEEKFLPQILPHRYKQAVSSVFSFSSVYASAPCICYHEFAADATQTGNMQIFPFFSFPFLSSRVENISGGENRLAKCFHTKHIPALLAHTQRPTKALPLLLGERSSSSEGEKIASR